MNDLDELMNDLAQQVRVVDLSDRVRASSRRLTIRRHVMTAAAGITALAVASGLIVTLNLRPDQRTTPPPAATATTSAPSPSPAGTALRLTPVERPAWKDIPGTLRYVTFDGQTHLWTLRDGTAAETFTPETGGCAMAVSPDGTRLMWGTSDGASTGDLVVARIDGTRPQTIMRNIACGGGRGPYWLPDSRHLLVLQDGEPGRVLVDVTTGAVSATTLAASESYVAFSPSGTTMAYQDGTTIVVARPDGSVIRRVEHGDETPTGGFSLQAISDDGRRAVLGYRNTDPTQIRSGFRLIDTTTGKNLATPAGAGSSTEKPSIYLLQGGKALIRAPKGNTSELILTSANGTVLDRRTEPAALAGKDLILVPGVA